MPGRLLVAVDPDHADLRPVHVAAALAGATASHLLLAAVYEVPAADALPAADEAEAREAAATALEAVAAVAAEVPGSILGGVSRRLVHEAACPVLVVPRGGEEAVAGLAETASLGAP